MPSWFGTFSQLVLRRAAITSAAPPPLDTSFLSSGLPQPAEFGAKRRRTIRALRDRGLTSAWRMDRLVQKDFGEDFSASANAMDES
ncbi:hypothetical protein D9615_007195 [Tricholomella constricta]|uniref:Uncharacterized protein n=1 Tax=Tricholomella constricta TaxID=117010 RepID=A0A8H5M263_9AGAR|nr:hypothetical protein D9615_007195 [Tricholomella constricta]